MPAGPPGTNGANRLADHVILFLLMGGWGEQEVEQTLARAHRAAAMDLLAVLRDTGLIDRVVVATDDPISGDALAGPGVEVDLDPPGEPFHLGRRLAELIERYRAEHVLYSGGGSAPLLAEPDWRGILERLLAADRLVIANNLHSCDWMALTSASEALPLIAGQASDNGLAWALTEAGLPGEGLPPTATARFDLDTPADLLIARHHPRIGPRLRAFVDGLTWDVDPVQRVLEVMAREGSSLAVVGRTSAAAWAALERATRCWVRVFAEERGMRASGRLSRGEVRSLLADHLALTGVEEFFAHLTGLVEGVLLDSRVMLAAQGLWPSTADRFNSDLYRWDSVQDPFLRRFTRAAMEARVPVVLGGHSVVAGGLMALVESLDRSGA